MLFGSKVVFENALFRAQYRLTPIAKQFSTSKTQIFPLGILRFDHEDSCSLDLSCLFPRTLGTALEVVEVDVLEDDAI